MNITIHEGRRLKRLIESRFKKKTHFMRKVNMKDYNMLTYYFQREQIKRPKLLEFLKILGVSLEDFYADNVTPIVNTTIETHDNPNTLSMPLLHQGKQLDLILKEKGVTKKYFAEKMDVSRVTLDRLLDLEELPIDKLLHAAEILKISPAQIKGLGEEHAGFEKDIYLQLLQINEKLLSIENTIRLIKQK